MIRKVYNIFVKNNGNIGEIDATCGENDAKYLVKQYQKQYGNEWEIWAQDKDGNKLDA